MLKPRIMVIEDESAMRMALEDCLKAEGYRVLAASDGESGLERVLKEQPDLVLLDIMMPKLDGFSLCHELRRLGYQGGILILTAKGKGVDRVKGLDLGADDFVTKPFLTEELLARVRAVLRRQGRQNKELDTLVVGRVKLDMVKYQAHAEGLGEIHLTAKEWAMLRLMAECAGEAVSREKFLDAVWGYASFPTTRTVDNHIASLRSKLEENPEQPQWILTVHGVGYRLVQKQMVEKENQ